MSYLSTKEANYKMSPAGKDGQRYPYIMRKSGKASGGGSPVEKRILVTIARAQARAEKSKPVLRVTKP